MKKRLTYACIHFPRPPDKTFRKLRAVGRLVGLFFLSWAVYQGLYGFFYSSRNQLSILRPYRPENMSPLKPSPLISVPSDKCLKETTELEYQYQLYVNTQNFRLHLGEGNFVSKFTVKFKWIGKPYVMIAGWATPTEEDEDRVRVQNGHRSTGADMTTQTLQGLGYEDEFEDHGVNIKVKEKDNQWEGSVWYKGSSDGESCASLEIELVFPALYIFNHIHLTGGVVDVQFERMGILELGSILVDILKGDFRAPDGLHTDNLKVRVQDGSIQVKDLAASKRGQPVQVSAISESGNVALSVETTMVPKDESLQRISAVSTYGDVELKIRPDLEEGDKEKGLVPGQLELIAKSTEGKIYSKVKLLKEPQELSLKAESKSGDVGVSVSKEFSGKFDLSTEEDGKTLIRTPRSGSNSKIEYDKQTRYNKKGTKLSPFVGGPASGKIKLTSHSGNVYLQFD